MDVLVPSSIDAVVVGVITTGSEVLSTDGAEVRSFGSDMEPSSSSSESSLLRFRKSSEEVSPTASVLKSARRVLGGGGTPSA